MRALGTGSLLLLASLTLTPHAKASTVCLVLSGHDPERVIVRLPVEENVSFCLEFINSIYQAPVRETFAYERGEGLYLIRVESPSAGVFEYYGLPPDGTGSAEMRRKLGDIRLLSHDYQHHRLRVGNRIIRLKGMVLDGRPLTIGVRTDRACEP